MILTVSHQVQDILTIFDHDMISPFSSTLAKASAESLAGRRRGSSSSSKTRSKAVKKRGSGLQSICDQP
jgi:hypothetical protein